MVLTGSWAIIDWNCGGLTTPESRRYSSSVRTVFKERLMPALSPILVNVLKTSDQGDMGVL